jgi:RNA-directed DNA polymerase
MKQVNNIFKNIISPENLFASWEEFKHGKTRKDDVLEFSYNLEGNIFSLARELANKSYCHSNYTSFKINDPKPRHIHKATVRDRIVHRALFRVLNSVFESMFISDSFSCRIGKGHHRGFFRAAEFLRKASANNTKVCFVLKCDIRKFFDSVDHEVLKRIIRKKIIDQDALGLIDKIIDSYTSKEWIPAFAGMTLNQDNSISERERERE